MGGSHWVMGVGWGIPLGYRVWGGGIPLSSGVWDGGIPLGDGFGVGGFHWLMGLGWGIPLAEGFGVVGGMKRGCPYTPCGVWGMGSPLGYRVWGGGIPLGYRVWVGGSHWVMGSGRWNPIG